MIDLSIKTPIYFYVIGVITLFSLVGCQSKQTPVEVTQGFWSQIIGKKLNRAKQYCSEPSQQLPNIQDNQLSKSSFSYGKIVIDGDNSTVDVKISLSSGKVLPITTFLIKRDEEWKVDCSGTAIDLNGNRLFKDFFTNLNEMGENINKQLKEQLPIIEKGIKSFGQELQQQLPAIEKEIESIGQELQQQMENFGNELKKSTAKKEAEPYGETI